MEETDIEVDVDGDDQAVFGEAQFTEGDIVPVTISRLDVEEEAEVEIEDDVSDEGSRTLQELVAATAQIRQEKPCLKRDVSIAEGDADQAIVSARQRGDKASLIVALENKIKLLVSYGLAMPQVKFQELILPKGTQFVCNNFCNSIMPYMSGPIQRAYSVNWLLAHMLQGVLVTLLGFYKTLSHL